MGYTQHVAIESSRPQVQPQWLEVADIISRFTTEKVALRGYRIWRSVHRAKIQYTENYRETP